MVVKSDGTKWACQSCLKGHRVSGCTHTDRELHLVPKKGRPVTQCSHCRLERKKRSAHVSCQCGETDKQPSHSREKCIHLREAEERAKAGVQHVPSEETDASHFTNVAAEQGCCCSHGGKCSCASLKRESPTLDEFPHGPTVKPRLEATRSDGSITVFQNGHHKPVHRKNHAAHESGMPYKMPLQRATTDHSLRKVARRSVDSLALNSNVPFHPQILLPRNIASSNKDRHTFGSEQPSPEQLPVDMTRAAIGSTRMNSMDFNTLGLAQTNQSQQSAASDHFAWPPLEPLSSLADEEYNPWSVLPSGDSNAMPNNNPFGVWATNSDMSMTQPALTAASSGTQSEVDEIPGIDDMYGIFGMPSIQEDVSGQINGAQGPTSPQSNRHSLPPNFFSPSDLMTSMHGDWPAGLDFYASAIDDKSRSSENMPSPDYQDPWRAPNRTIGGLPFTGRPASQSVGASNVPAADIMHQLFPDMDSMFSPNKSTIQTTTPPIDFGPMECNPDFNDPTWRDESMNMPVDAFTASAVAFDDEMSPDFCTPDFNATWAQ